MRTMNLFKVLLITSIAIVSLSSLCLAKGFTDIDSSHWAFQYVDELSNKGIINGYDDGRFKPSGTITRAEFIKLLVATDEDLVKNVDYMKSKSTSNKWYEPYVNIAGTYIGGMPYYSNQQFEFPITRTEVAYITTLFMRFSEKKIENSKEKIEENSKEYISAMRKANEKLNYIEDKELSDTEFTTKLFSLTDEQRNKLSEETDNILNPPKETTDTKAVTPEEKQMMVVAWNKVLKEMDYTENELNDVEIEKICDQMTEDEFREAYTKMKEEYFILYYQIFNDISDLSLKEIVALVKMKEANIINGYEDGSFKPHNTITRAEASKVLYQYTQTSQKIKEETK